MSLWTGNVSAGEAVRAIARSQAHLPDNVLLVQALDVEAVKDAGREVLECGEEGGEASNVDALVMQEVERAVVGEGVSSGVGARVSSMLTHLRRCPSSRTSNPSRIQC